MFQVSTVNTFGIITFEIQLLITNVRQFFFFNSSKQHYVEYCILCQKVLNIFIFDPHSLKVPTRSNL